MNKFKKETTAAYTIAVAMNIFERVGTLNVTFLQSPRLGNFIQKYVEVDIGGIFFAGCLCFSLHVCLKVFKITYRGYNSYRSIYLGKYNMRINGRATSHSLLFSYQLIIRIVAIIIDVRLCCLSGEGGIRDAHLM